MRLVGRWDYRVVVCRTTRLGRLRPVYRSDRMFKAVAKNHVAALVTLAESAVGASEQTTPRTSVARARRYRPPPGSARSAIVASDGNVLHPAAEVSLG